MLLKLIGDLEGAIAAFVEHYHRRRSTDSCSSDRI
jgi:hypothetical protein